MSAGKRVVRIRIGELAVSHWWSCCGESKPCTDCDQDLNCCFPDELLLTLSGFSNTRCDCSFADGITFTVTRELGPPPPATVWDVGGEQYCAFRCWWAYWLEAAQCSGTWLGVGIKMCYYRWWSGAGYKMRVGVVGGLIYMNAGHEYDIAGPYTYSEGNAITPPIPNCTIDGWEITSTFTRNPDFPGVTDYCLNAYPSYDGNDVTALIEYP